MMKSTKKSIVNIHVPKTAGTLFRHQLAGHMKVSGIDKIVNSTETAVIKRLNQVAVPMLLSDKPCLVSGHYFLSTIAKTLAPYRANFSYVTFVREPCARIVSDYWYTLSEVNPGHETMREKYPGFEDFLADEDCRNKVFKFLRPFEGATVVETFSFLKNQFDFVGMTERYESHADLFFGNMGLSRVDDQKINVGETKAEAEKTLASFKNKIAETHDEDIELYELIKSEWSNAAK